MARSQETELNDEQWQALENWRMATVCDQFALDYKESHPGAIIKVGNHVSDGFQHCYVYDPELDLTIDPTQGQFGSDHPDTAYVGDCHPNVENVESYETVEDYTNGVEW